MNFLAVGAHLDDIEIAAGGLLADAVAGGHKVFMCSLTDSAAKDVYGDVDRALDIATQEGKAGAAVIGAESLEILGFPVNSLPYDGESVSAVERVIIKVQPDVILTHWPHDTHQDHRAAAMTTISAARRHNRILMFEPFTPSGRSYESFRGQAYHKVSAEGQKKKRLALEAHESQNTKYGESEWINAVEARGVLRGFEIGADFAECFEVLRWDLDFSMDILGQYSQ